jgi:hypothetical protein
MLPLPECKGLTFAHLGSAASSMFWKIEYEQAGNALELAKQHFEYVQGRYLDAMQRVKKDSEENHWQGATQPQAKRMRTCLSQERQESEEDSESGDESEIDQSWEY